MKMPNHVIIFGSEDKQLSSITNEMKSLGWRVTHHHDMSDFAKCERKGFLTGIVYIDNALSRTIQDIETLLNESMTKWVAVVDDDIMNNSDVRRAISRFFCSYHTFPVDPEKLHDTLDRLQAMAMLEMETHEEGDSDDDEHECRMVGNSPVMKALYRTIHKVAHVDAPVFIQGESGTGKELTARAIHDESARAEQPFNAVNCGALPANLIQSELFGHEKGAFTGASQRKVGIIENTQGGTLFLDEIGDLPLDMQVNLLRFLENNTIQRVGGLKEISVDVRVLAATHVDLETAVREERFREDLYHRLNVLQIKVPPLRERGDDIEILANFFFKKFANEKSMQVCGFNKESLALMRLYDWPGNIRELINRIRRAMVMCEHHFIRPDDLGLERRHSASRYAESLEEARDMAERSVVLAALARNRFNIQHAARELGISRVTLYRLMEKHGINRDGDAGGKGVGHHTSDSTSKVLHLSTISKRP